MKVLSIIATIAVVFSASAMETEKELAVGTASYAVTIGILQGVGQGLYSYSGAPKYSYNTCAIMDSDLNVFKPFPKYVTSSMGKQRAFNAAQVFLKTGSVISAPARSFLATLCISSNPIGALCYLSAHPATGESLKHVMISLLKTPRYALGALGTGLAVGECQNFKKYLS